MSHSDYLPGLTFAEVEESRRLHGANVLTPPPRTPLWSRFLQKFSDPLIIVLLIAGVLSIGISCYEYWGLSEGAAVFFEPVGIFIAILLATGLGFIFEVKAEKEFEILNRVSDDELVEVMRDGNITTVPRKDVVVGDIVILSTGQEIPADGDLLEAVRLSVDESTLTGEPMAHKTTVEAEFDSDATYPSDRVLRGTKVMEGHGVMRVDRVGDEAECGKVYRAAQIDDNVKTPLGIQLERLGKLISYISYIVGGIVIFGRLLMYFINTPFDWMSFAAYFLQTVMIAVTLIVVAVPEGLPMAVTLSLAYSMRRMLRTNNLVRKLHACETMGATTVICTDKTGTLTQNRMQVSHVDFFGNPSDDIIAGGMAANSTAQLDYTDPDNPEVVGNPTEGALLLWLLRRGEDYREIRRRMAALKELPFSTERKYMATLVHDSESNRDIIFLKGAPEIVYSLCDDTSGVTRSEIDALLAGYQVQAMRTLGFAYRELAPGESPESVGDMRDLKGGFRFVGVAAISDPVRPDVPDAVAEVTGAGIGVKIVTGDTPGTAREIGRQIGLWNDAVDNDSNLATGQEIEAMSDKELEQRAPQLKIIARARPMDKKRLVEALQRDGEVVAVTGDGTNDAPALKAAQVGLSMGDGTSVAKEASDITIIDNSFASIGRAVMWGRSLYRNIQRFILFQMTVNVVACLVVMCGAFMGTESPLTVTQMLWVNLIMDTFAAMALASLPPTRSVMADKPRSRTAFIISRDMWRSIIGVGLFFFAILISILYYLDHVDIRSLSQIPTAAFGVDSGLNSYELSVFFTIFVFLQFWNMFNARAFATGRSAFHFKGCGGFVLIAAVILIGQILIVQIGGQFFNVRPLASLDWLLIIAGTSPVLLLGELLRLFHRK